MTRIEMTQRSDGADIATCGKFTATSKNGAQMKLARMLVAAGVPDGPWQTERKGRVGMFGPSLHRLAALTVTGGDSTPKIIKWVAYDKYAQEAA